MFKKLLFPFLLSICACSNVPKMYEEFNASPKKSYSNSSEAFKAVKPSKVIPLNEKTSVDLDDHCPILTLDTATGNKGYFKVVKFEVKSEDTYIIRGLLNCRCFGKFSGKNVVIPRLFLWDTQSKKILTSKPGLQKEHSFWSGDEYYNKIEAALKSGTHYLLIAADNTSKGGSLFSVESYGASSVTPLPVMYDISAAPDGTVDLIIQSKTELQKNK